MKHTVSVVIPNYNGEELLKKNLPQVIAAMDNPKNNILEIVVVDDGSADKSVNLVKSTFPQVKLIKHTKNRGFSSAVNTGVRGTKGSIILLLNSDVVPEKDFLVNALDNFKDDRVFAVSLHEKDYGYAKGKFENGYVALSMGPESNKVEQSFYVSGGSGLFSKEHWKSLGGMDESTLSPFYWEDIDICYRATKRGLICLWDPSAKVVHKHESTISKLSKKYVGRVRERNQILFIWKNITSLTLIRKHLVGLIRRLIKTPGYIVVILMALGRLGTVLGKRKREVKESKLSDEVIFSRF